MSSLTSTLYEEQDMDKPLTDAEEDELNDANEEIGKLLEEEHKQELIYEHKQAVKGEDE